jgi:hypothetical protein
MPNEARRNAANIAKPPECASPGSSSDGATVTESVGLPIKSLERAERQVQLDQPNPEILPQPPLQYVTLPIYLALCDV